MKYYKSYIKHQLWLKLTHHHQQQPIYLLLFYFSYNSCFVRSCLAALSITQKQFIQNLKKNIPNQTDSEKPRPKKLLIL